MARSILIVDDSAAVRRSLRSVIEENADWRVCGEAENGAIAVERGHIRTVPIPQWAKQALDLWTPAAGVTGGSHSLLSRPSLGRGSQNTSFQNAGEPKIEACSTAT